MGFTTWYPSQEPSATRDHSSQTPSGSGTALPRQSSGVQPMSASRGKHCQWLYALSVHDVFNCTWNSHLLEHHCTYMYTFLAPRCVSTSIRRKVSVLFWKKKKKKFMHSPVSRNPMTISSKQLWHAGFNTKFTSWQTDSFEVIDGFILNLVMIFLHQNLYWCVMQKSSANTRHPFRRL